MRAPNAAQRPRHCSTAAAERYGDESSQRSSTRSMSLSPRPAGVSSGPIRRPLSMNAMAPRSSDQRMQYDVMNAPSCVSLRSQRHIAGSCIWWSFGSRPRRRCLRHASQLVRRAIWPCSTSTSHRRPPPVRTGLPARCSRQRSSGLSLPLRTFSGALCVYFMLSFSLCWLLPFVRNRVSGKCKRNRQSPRRLIFCPKPGPRASLCSHPYDMLSIETLLRLTSNYAC